MPEEKKVKKPAIVVRIMTALGLGDEGKIGKFFAKEAKKCRIELKKLGSNLKTTELKYSISKEQLEERLEDAVEAVQAAYDAVTPEDVPNNAAMDSFATSYWGGIDAAEAEVKSLEEELEELEEINKITVEEIEEDITKYKVRLKAVS